MAKCIDCGFPYATNKECPNCKSKSPNGTILRSLFAFLFLGFIVAGIFFLGNSTNNSIDQNENEIPISSISSNDEDLDSSNTSELELSDENINKENEELEHINYQSIMYECRQCKIPIEWIGSYSWTCNDETLESEIIEYTNMELAGDDRVDTEMYHDEGHSFRGVFCSKQCANRNLEKWKIEKL